MEFVTLNRPGTIPSFIRRPGGWLRLALVAVWFVAVAAAQAASQPNIAGTILADDEPGVDIGARINAAVSRLPVDPYGVATGFITLAAERHAVYYFSTSIHFDSLTVTLDCRGASLVWTGTNAASAIILAGPLRRNPTLAQALIAVGSANGGIENCNLQTLQTYLNKDRNNPTTNPAFVPSIRDVTVHAGGKGYAPGDIVQLQQNGGALGTLLVTDSRGGSVTGLSVLHGGYEYTTGAGLLTSGGHGTGLTVNIVSNPPVACYPYNRSPTLPTAIFSGGDPTGNILSDPPANFGNNQYLRHVHVSGFCGAFVPGNNMWQNQFDGVTFDHNYWDIDDEYSALITNTGERSTFISSRLDGATGAAIRNDGGSQFTIGNGTSIDYNEQLNASGQWTGGVPVIGKFLQLDFESAHIEDQCGPVIAEDGTYRGYVHITDGDIRVANAKPCSTAYFEIAGSNGAFSASHVVYDAMHAVPVYFSNPTNGAVLEIADPAQGTEGKLPACLSANGTEPITNFGSSRSYSPTNPGFVWSSTGPASATVAAFEAPTLASAGASHTLGQFADISVGRDLEDHNNVRMRFYDVGGPGSRSNYGELLVGGERSPDLTFGDGRVVVPGTVAAGSHAGLGSAGLATGPAAGVKPEIACAISHVCDSAGGTVTLTTGSSPLTGLLAKIDFGISRSKSANCVLDTLSSTGLVSTNTWTESSTDLTVTARSPLLASSVYTIKYWCSGS